MPTEQQRIGVPQIFLSVDTPNSVPDLNTLPFTACDVVPTDPFINDVNQPLLTTDTYQIIVGLVGRDNTNGGYTVGECTPSGGNVTIATAGNGIKVKVLNTDWPANFDEAICAAIFLKINSAKFQLAQFAYIDPAANFTTTLIVKPLRVAPRFETATLQSNTVHPVLGDRLPLGVVYEEISPTTAEFNFRRPVSNVTVSPNNAPDFQVATSRGVGITFQSLVNDIKTFVRAAAGVYVKYSDGADTVEEAQLSLNTAQAVLKGNRAVQVFMPPDNFGNQEVRLLIGLLTTNQTELTEAWSKTAVTSVTFQFDPASLDKLITNAHTEIQYLRRSG
jgi:hypothetical protein